MLYHHEFDDIDLTPVNFTDWSRLIEAVKKGTIDGAFLFAPTLLALNNRDFFVKCVLLGHRNGSSFFVSPGSDISSEEDLRGKRVGIPSELSTQKILLSKMIGARNIPLNDIDIVYLKPYQMINALRIREIDAFFVAEPCGAIAENKGYG